MNVHVTTDVTTVEQADTAVLEALDHVRRLRGLPGNHDTSRVVAMAAVVDAYLLRARMWTLLEVPACEVRDDLLRALNAAASADRDRARHWRGVAARATS